MRLFAAVPLDDEARNYVRDVVSSLVRAGVEARWVRQENWHATLAFLGEVDSADVRRVRATFVDAATRCGSFMLQLSTVGAFPNLRRPRVLFVGGESRQEAFASAAGIVRGAFEPLGFRFDDDAIAHVTVGRTRVARAIDPPAPLGRCEMRVNRLVLYCSAAEARGVRYDEIESVELGNPRM